MTTVRRVVENYPATTAGMVLLAVISIVMFLMGVR